MALHHKRWKLEDIGLITNTRNIERSKIKLIGYKRYLVQRVNELELELDKYKAELLESVNYNDGLSEKWSLEVRRQILIYSLIGDYSYKLRDEIVFIHDRVPLEVFKDIHEEHSIETNTLKKYVEKHYNASR